MRNNVLSFFCLILFSGYLFAQDIPPVTKTKKKDRPVRSMFESGMLIDGQTSVTPIKKTFEMVIQHRFGIIKTNGISDLFGIYAPSSNTRMGFNFSILDNLQIGYGITRKNMYSDFHMKWAFLRQTRSGKIPLNLAIYANMAIDSRNKTEFGTDYRFSNRLSYFTEVIAGRKFNDWLSVEIKFNFTHFNTVSSNDYPNPPDTIPAGYNHDVIGVGGHARFKFSPQSAFLIMYTQPLNIKGLNEKEEIWNTRYANVGIAYEVSTSTHVFQIFATVSNGIIPQEIYLFNSSQWAKGEFRLGFNITRLWNF